MIVHDDPTRISVEFNALEIKKNDSVFLIYDHPESAIDEEHAEIPAKSREIEIKEQKHEDYYVKGELHYHYFPRYSFPV